MANFKLTQTAQQVQNDLDKVESIVANPTLTGTETDLTGLQVGSTKYKVHSGGGGGGGTQLYKHTLVFASYAHNIIIITNTNLEITSYSQFENINIIACYSEKNQSYQSGSSFYDESCSYKKQFDEELSPHPGPFPDYIFTKIIFTNNTINTIEIDESTTFSDQVEMI